MTTETINLPPCPLPGCEGGEHHYHDIDIYTLKEGHDCVSEANLGYRCYSQHRPQWQPIEHDQIKAGMRIRAFVYYALLDIVTTHTGVAHHTDEDGDWRTEGDVLLTGWYDSTTYEVDPATIPDPDADLVEKAAIAIYEGVQHPNWRAPLWEETDAHGQERFLNAARAALAAIRGSEVTA